MKIREIKENKKQFLSLLLLADEQENMIDRSIFLRLRLLRRKFAPRLQHLFCVMSTFYPPASL